MSDPRTVCLPCQFGNCGGCNGYCSCGSCGGAATAAPMTDQPEMMRTRRGTRLVARAGRGDDNGAVVLVVTGIEINMTADESRQLRELLQAAEIDEAACFERAVANRGAVL